ncbi:glycosyltransferase [Bosea caraganae]|uniref:Glycosyltransferase n=1 Tax=Bosea caraganae TaxID=2763117 RepID=A0A370L8E8_9HYPH|nr:glycosyltransferase [Bosea caraganae]RDJ25196.1 glycosyltransferase [Bosea caraganae]RDJ26306.1 glycosyltransferase [Bosea caraganae]
MMLRIAWLSPWNTKSAIATFGAPLVAELRRRGHEVSVFRTEVGAAAEIPSRCDSAPVRMLGATSPQQLRADFDGVIANIGNNFSYHGALPDLMDRLPVLGIFHDGFLAHLADVWAEDWLPASQSPRRLAEAVYGAGNGGAAEFWLPLEQMVTERPMLEWLAPMVSGAVVHSHGWAGRLRAACSGAVTVQPLTMPDDGMPEPPQPGPTLVVATIGDVNPNKQADQVLRAIASRPDLKAHCQYRLIGEVGANQRTWLEGLAAELGIAPPRFTGWIDDDALKNEMRSVDVVCCLRNPIIEAGSASLITGMRSARPVLVSNHGVYADVPADLVLRCEPGREAADVARHLTAILADRAAAAAMGRRARAYVRETNSAERYVDGLLPALAAANAAAPAIGLARRLGRQFGELGMSPDSPQGQRLMAALSDMFQTERQENARASSHAK